MRVAIRKLHHDASADGVTDMSAQVDEALAMPGGGVWEVGPGQVTDDSEMALCLLRGLETSAPPALPEEAIARAYADWYNSRPFDIGALHWFWCGSVRQHMLIASVRLLADVLSMRMLYWNVS